uniref:Uncharacterized protein n=1 Tax=Oryza brachyantha TaxID=4533 RepID=J3LKH1_ORYBR
MLPEAFGDNKYTPCPPFLILPFLELPFQLSTFNSIWLFWKPTICFLVPQTLRHDYLLESTEIYEQSLWCLSKLLLPPPPPLIL